MESSGETYRFRGAGYVEIFAARTGQAGPEDAFLPVLTCGRMRQARSTLARVGRVATPSLFVLAAALGLGGCDDSTPPTTPPAPPGEPVPTAVEIRGLPEEPFEVGAVVQLTAWATFSDGASQQVDPVWQSSNQTVARVDQNGFLFAQAAGETRITANFGPVTGAADVAVAPANPEIYDLGGQVVNHNGNPVADVLIVAVDGPAAGRATMTYPNGWYSLNDLEGETTIAARKDGYAEATGLATRQADRLDFTLTGGAPRDSFGGGQWIVGDEILPGTYFTDPDPYCGWSRRSGFSIGSLTARAALMPFESPPDHDFIAGRELRFDSGQEIVDVHPGDAAFRSISECGEWRPEPPHTGVQEQIRPGTWLVGAQIAPGTYRADAGYLCLWLRLSGFGGGQDDIVEDGLVETRAGAELTVTIEESDAGFYSDEDCGPWTRVEDP